MGMRINRLGAPAGGNRGESHRARVGCICPWKYDCHSGCLSQI